MLSSLLIHISRLSSAVGGNIVTFAERAPSPTSSVSALRSRLISLTFFVLVTVSSILAFTSGLFALITVIVQLPSLFPVTQP